MARAKKHTGWTRLDNAAKIFPPTSDKRDPKVFRFACELFETVEKDILQEALDKTLEAFQGYLSVMKHGFFWYYLESTVLRPVVHEDNEQICGPLYDKNEHSLLFDVSYYKKRINVEVYHALSDGTGALEFIRALVCNYLVLAHRDELSGVTPLSGYDGSAFEQMDDSFQKYYDPKRKKGTRMPRAHKIHGARISENRMKVIEGVLSVDKILALARERGTTITVLLTAVLLCSIANGMSVREKKKPVTISVPVNLRNYFASESTRNFFGIISVFYDFAKEPDELEAVIRSVARQLKENLTQEKLAEHMNSLVAMERNFAIRAIPLVVKDFGLRFGYYVNEQSVTAAMSNIGQIKMPEEYVKYIRLFDVMTSTRKVQICMCSFQNNMVINFTDNFSSSDIQKYFFRTLSDMRLDVTITANPLDEWREKE